MKLFVIGLLVFFTILLLSVGSSVYFFDVNDYNKWLSDQVKESTGYDIRFEQLENNWLTDHSILLHGVSLYQQQQRIVFIKSIDIQVDTLDFWQQQMHVNSIRLTGVEIKFDKPLDIIKTDLTLTPNSEMKNNMHSLPWEKLHINRFIITDLNAQLKYQDKKLSIQKMHFELNDLLIIQHKQLQTLAFTLKANAQIKALQLTDEKYSTQFNDVELFLQGNLLQRQAKLVLNIASMSIAQPEMQFDSIKLAMQLKKNRLFVENLSMNAFSGSLIMQADAMLDISLLPRPDIKVKKVTLQSMLLKDMQITLPVFNLSGSETKKQQPVNILPIESLLLKHLQLEKININSDNTNLPLTINGLNLTLSDHYFIKQNQWLTFPQDTEQTTKFSLSFAYLSWKEAIVEQFSTVGHLTEDDQSLLFLQQQLIH